MTTDISTPGLPRAPDTGAPVSGGPTEHGPGGAGAPRPGGRRHGAASVVVSAVAFVVVTGETLPVGLIGDVARGVGATESQIGLTVGWYALVAAVGAVPLTRLTARLDRRRVLVACAVVFGAGHVIAALATNLPVLLTGRSVAALSHGLYFAVATPAVVRVARAGTELRAGGRVAVGGSMALVLGTPLATVLGQSAGWRVAMLAVAAVAVVLALVVLRLLPPLPAVRRDATAGRDRRRAGGVRATLRSPALATVLVVTVVVVTGHFALFTYVAPYADEQLGLEGRAFSTLLLAYGAAAVLGSTLAGRLAERSPLRSVRVAAVALVAATTGMWVAARLDAGPVAAALLVLWSGTFSVLAVSTGLAIVRRAPAAQAETAFALHGIVFQAGILGGSALGALAYTVGHLDLLPLVTAGAGAVVLLVLASAGRAFRAATPSAPVGAAPEPAALDGAPVRPVPARPDLGPVSGPPPAGTGAR